MAEQEPVSNIYERVAAGLPVFHGYEIAVKRGEEFSLEKTRLMIAKWVIITYCLVIVLTAAVLVVRSWCAGENPFPSLLELLKVGILPIVTFIIGFFFGTGTKAQ